MAVVPMWDVLKYFREKGLWHYAKICDTMTGFVTLCLCTTLHRFQWILPAILCNLTLFCCCCCSQCKFWQFFVRFKGLLISKGLFAILEFLQKTNETIQSQLLGQKNEFLRSFFGRIVGLKITLRTFNLFPNGGGHNCPKDFQIFLRPCKCVQFWSILNRFCGRCIWSMHCFQPTGDWASSK